MATYLTDLSQALSDEGIDAPLFIVTSPTALLTPLPLPRVLACMIKLPSLSPTSFNGTNKTVFRTEGCLTRRSNRHSKLRS